MDSSEQQQQQVLSPPSPQGVWNLDPPPSSLPIYESKGFYLGKDSKGEECFGNIPSPKRSRKESGWQPGDAIPSNVTTLKEIIELVAPDKEKNEKAPYILRSSFDKSETKDLKEADDLEYEKNIKYFKSLLHDEYMAYTALEILVSERNQDLKQLRTFFLTTPYIDINCPPSLRANSHILYHLNARTIDGANCMQFLIDHRADVNVDQRQARGTMPLLFFHLDSPPTIELLLENKASLDDLNQYDMTIHTAIRCEIQKRKTRTVIGNRTYNPTTLSASEIEPLQKLEKLITSLLDKRKVYAIEQMLSLEICRDMAILITGYLVQADYSNIFYVSTEFNNVYNSRNAYESWSGFEVVPVITYTFGGQSRICNTMETQKMWDSWAGQVEYADTVTDWIDWSGQDPRCRKKRKKGKNKGIIEDDFAPPNSKAGKKHNGNKSGGGSKSGFSVAAIKKAKKQQYKYSNYKGASGAINRPGKRQR